MQYLSSFGWLILFLTAMPNLLFNLHFVRIYSHFSLSLQNHFSNSFASISYQSVFDSEKKQGNSSVQAKLDLSINLPIEYFCSHDTTIDMANPAQFETFSNIPVVPNEGEGGSKLILENKDYRRLLKAGLLQKVKGGGWYKISKDIMHATHYPKADKSENQSIAPLMLLQNSPTAAHSFLSWGRLPTELKEMIMEYLSDEDLISLSMLVSFILYALLQLLTFCSSNIAG